MRRRLKVKLDVVVNFLRWCWKVFRAGGIKTLHKEKLGVMELAKARVLSAYLRSCNLDLNVCPQVTRFLRGLTLNEVASMASPAAHKNLRC